MPMTPRRIILLISLAMAASLQPAQARSATGYTPQPTASPIDNYFTRQATTHNGQQVARVLDPALGRLLQSGQLTSEQIKAMEQYAAQLAAQPGGLGAALEQLAGSHNANLAAATQGTTQHLGNRLLDTLRALPSDDAGHFWVKNLGNEGDVDGQRGSTGLDTATQGLLLGADWAIDHAWRVGVLGAKSTGRLDAQRFSADLDNWHLGAYAVRQDGPLALRLGAIYSSHAGKNQRTIDLAGRKQTLQSRYDATSQNAFAEAGYQLGDEDYSIEPFAGLGYQRYQRDSFKEHGGAAALKVHAQTQQNLSSTLGLRLAKAVRFDNQVILTPHLSAGWKHLYGDVESSVRQSFRAGAVEDFSIRGTSLDRNSLNLVTGLDLTLTPRHAVGLAYTAETGTHASNQGLMGQWRMTF